jgi:hypothetical protein
MWRAYMGTPWTREGTVRTYVVTMAPEVAGRIVELPVADNQFVHTGDLLLVIDPLQDRSQTGGCSHAAGRTKGSAATQAERSGGHRGGAARERRRSPGAISTGCATAIRPRSIWSAPRSVLRSMGGSPIAWGWLGDYATVGRSVISVVDAHSFWVDAYFGDRQLASIHEGDPAEVKLMGYSQIVRGEVGSLARGINVSKPCF